LEERGVKVKEKESWLVDVRTHQKKVKFPTIEFCKALERHCENSNIGISFLADNGLTSVSNVAKPGLFHKWIPISSKNYDVYFAVFSTSYLAKANKKRIYTISDVSAKSEKDKQQLQKQIDSADVLIFHSEYLKKEVLNNYKVDNKKLQVLCPVFPFSKVNSIKPNSLPIGEFIYYSGSLDDERVVQTLLDILNKLPFLNLVISGTSDQRTMFRWYKKFTESKMAKRILLTGALEKSEQAYLYENCKVFCCPTQEEKFPHELLEAMRYGRPIIASRTESIFEIAQETIFYWDNFQPEHIATVFQQSLIKYNRDSEEEAQKIMEQGSLFTFEKMMKGYLGLMGV